MDREKARKILGEEATEEQITNLLNNWHLDENAKVKELEEQINSLTATAKKYSDYDEIKSKLDEINKANMTEQEKLEQMKKETESNLKQSRIIVNTAKAKEILAGESIDDELINRFVVEDTNVTIAMANKFKETLSNLRTNVEKQTRESLSTQDLKPSITNVNQDDGIMTLEKFSDLSAEEQNKWLQDNPNGLSNLN